MYIWKNLKTYYNYNLKRILLTNFTKVERLSNIVNIRLTSEDSFKLTHFLYMYLLSRKKGIPHLIQFNIPTKYKRQSQRLKPKYKGFCRLSKTTGWRIFRKLYLIFYQYSAQETKGLDIKTELCKLNLYNTMDTYEANKLKSEKGYYPITTMTYNFIVRDSDYFYKWFLLRLLKLNYENLLWYDSKLLAPVDIYSCYKEWLDSNIIQLWNPFDDTDTGIEIKDEEQYLNTQKEIAAQINDEESSFLEFCSYVFVHNNVTDSILKQKRGLFLVSQNIYPENNNDTVDNIYEYAQNTIDNNISNIDIINYKKNLVNVFYKEDRWII